MKKKQFITLIMSSLCLIILGCSNTGVNNTNNEIIADENIKTGDNIQKEELDENKTLENSNEEDSTGTEKNEITYTTYENKQYKFSISVPDNRDFKENEYNFAAIFYTPQDDDISENLGISVQTPKIQQDLETYYKESMKNIADIYEGFNEISTSDIEINGLKGKTTIFEIEQDGQYAKSQQTVFIDDNNKVYILQYTATKDTFEKYKTEITNVINSFKLLN